MGKLTFALAGAAAVVVTIGSAATQASAQPDTGAGGVPPAAGIVSATPVTTTPHFKATQDSPTEQIRQLVACGGTMYGVGTFSDILKGSTTYPRENVFSFKETSPYTVTSWAPAVNGVVNSIAFNGSNCADAYIGGQFSSVNGSSAKNIAEVSTSGSGAFVSGFAHSASGSVQTMLGVNGHILAGGYYTSINGSSANPYMTSLNPATGTDDGFVHLSISGNYQFPGVSGNATRVYNQALSHSGQLDLVMGDFTSVGGLPRQQIFMLNLAGAHATVTGWTSSEFNGNCATVEPYYVQAAAWSPSDSTVYIGTTGFHPNGQPTGATPRTGLCDAAAAFPATQTSVAHQWVNYTGCDSLYAAAADSGAAYFAGHERWSMNPNDCDAMGPGAYNAPGIEGLQPTTGDLYVNTAGTAGYYSRARGLGADDELITSGGLWIGSDNFDGSQTCGTATNLAGICFLPYS
ncbi:MAG: hypothetical protein M3Y33_03900 [Actinomycetota bacterium]|nr:hypothetical protein [Actinomycetota bacterium]